MATSTPVWTDTGVNVVAAVVLARNALARGTLDLRAKVGAFVYPCVGRTGNNALTNGVEVRINRTLNANGRSHPASQPPLGPGQFAAGVGTTINGDVAAGASGRARFSLSAWAELTRPT